MTNGLRDIKGWLKAGFVFEGQVYDTETGTPQGGVISPLLAVSILISAWLGLSYFYSKLWTTVKYLQTVEILNFTPEAWQES
jgi:retron-type reverse transcriptase